MILALDIGNTNITMGVFDGRDLKFVSRLATDRQRTEDQYAVELRDIVDIYGVSIGEIEGSIISSVVPSLTSGIKWAVKRLTRTEPLCIGPGMKTGLNIKLNDPSTLGADLVAGAVAAIELFDCPCIIFDIGTATTIGQAMQYGWQDVFSLLALITINIGIFNLLPIPALDGCKLIFLLIEAIFGRAAPQKLQMVVNTAGMVLLLWLMVLVTMQDLTRFL